MTNYYISCQRKVEEIADFLMQERNQGIGLLSGKAGQSLFLFYHSKYKNSSIIHKRSIEVINDLFIQIEKSPQPFSFCSGIAGTCWLLDHLSNNGFIQADSNEMLSNADDYLYQVAQIELKKGNYDFLHGATGIIFYFAKRNRQDYLRHLIQLLVNIAIEEGDGVKWMTIIDHETGIKGFNISLSHGSSSIALVLCKVLQIMPKEKIVKTLLIKTVSYILNQKISVEKYGTFFPNTSIESQPILYKTRLAWCYGDLGVAIAIWQSGLILKNQDWIERGMTILLHAAARRGLKDNFVQDAGICHGTAGIAQIFNRLFRYTNQIEFKEAADYWVIETLKMAVFDDGLAGYKTWRTEKYGGWQTDENLLEGIAGIGLSLLSFVMQEDPAWDECLLIS